MTSKQAGAFCQKFGVTGIDSEAFSDVTYILAKGHLIIDAGSNGRICIEKDKLEEFLAEFEEIVENASIFFEREATKPNGKKKEKN